MTTKEYQNTFAYGAMSTFFRWWFPNHCLFYGLTRKQSSQKLFSIMKSDHLYFDVRTFTDVFLRFLTNQTRQYRAAVLEEYTDANNITVEEALDPAFFKRQSLAHWIHECIKEIAAQYLEELAEEV